MTNNVPHISINIEYSGAHGTSTYTPLISTNRRYTGGDNKNKKKKDKKVSNHSSHS